MNKTLTTLYLIAASLLRLLKSYKASSSCDVVSTTLNTSAAWLKNHGFFKDMNRDNDITYYVVGRGRKGVDPITGEEVSEMFTIVKLFLN